MPVSLVALPLLLAASPVRMGDVVPFTRPPIQSNLQDEGINGEVETFDPVARARLIAEQMPRRWSGRYQSFVGGVPVPVALRIDSATAIGQIVDVRGSMAIGGFTSAVQGNLNAKSDQLDLLLLGDSLGASLEPGGEFQGLQGLSLSGWHAPRLTTPGGTLQMLPDRTASGPAVPSDVPVRGLW
jgi:hypothetical protein